MFKELKVMKTNIFISNYNAFAKHLGSIYSRLASLSIVSRQSVLAILLTVGIGNVWAADGDVFYTITCPKNTSNSDYTKNDYSVSLTNNGQTITWITPGNQNINDAWRIGGKNIAGVARTITGNNPINKTIKKVQINYSSISGSSGHAAIVDSAQLEVSDYSSFTSIIETVKKTGLGLNDKSSAGNIAFTPSGSNWASGKYYRITIWCTNETNNNGGLNVTSIQFIEGTACTNSVTISAGTATNCTFTLSPSGAQASCSGVTTAISITPTTGYGTPEVTESGASSTPTPGGSGNSQTLTYAANTTGTSTINVSCSANTYTITLNKDLTPTTAGTASITATYNANTNLTSAITKPTKTGWTFGGYYTAKNGGGTQIIDASGNVVASVSGYTDASKNWKYAGNITLYAKWTCTVTWSVNGATNVYSTQTVTYNSSGSKVASIPGPPSPASYCGDKFVGWTTESSVSQDDDTGLGLFTTVSGSPDIKSIGDITFYAVFADYDE